MAKSIMIQGTMSNAGKSVLVGGLCRVLKQDGYRVAPFKSQNMALNSFITEDGLEMGRAQVMQAEAAGIRPDVNMNPILLKPTNDVGSQVIVNGRVTGTMSAVEYYKHKREYVPEIMKAYQKLEEDYDIIVIEGAGSPAEINLKSEDIVNMGLAKMVDAPVLLVGDIDRGGVFAQIVGTIMLLEEDEKRRIKGTIINKFRGDKAILQPGLDMLEDKTGIPVTGVMPYFYLEIDDEDSLSERFVKKDTVGLLDIAIMKLPRISNFTDFTALECMPEVSVRYVTTAGEFGNPDVVILPGTKNTIGDLCWMRQSGIEAKILQHAASGKVIFGICGGYQMLGENISDPDHAESAADEVRGMGLLPIETVFSKEKTRTRVHGTFAEVNGILSQMSGAAFDGYEIHMGETKLTGQVDYLMNLAVDAGGKQDEKQDGTSYGNVYGCYIHGVFDEPEVTRGFVSSLLKQKGISDVDVEGIDLAAFKEDQYDKLADIVRANLDMKAIYEIIEKGND